MLTHISKAGGEAVTGIGQSRGASLAVHTGGQTGGRSAPVCCRKVGWSGGADPLWTCSKFYTFPRSPPPHSPSPQNQTCTTGRQADRRKGRRTDRHKQAKKKAWGGGGARSSEAAWERARRSSRKLSSNCIIKLSCTSQHPSRNTLHS